jgi:hypothetical protein
MFAPVSYTLCLLSAGQNFGSQGYNSLCIMATGTNLEPAHAIGVRVKVLGSLVRILIVTECHRWSANPDLAARGRLHYLSPTHAHTPTRPHAQAQNQIECSEQEEIVQKFDWVEHAKNNVSEQQSIYLCRECFVEKRKCIRWNLLALQKRRTHT